MLCSSIVIDALKWLDPEDYTKDGRYETAKFRIQISSMTSAVAFHITCHRKMYLATSAQSAITQPVSIK
jgi:hypothetical protein